MASHCKPLDIIVIYVENIEVLKEEDITNHTTLSEEITVK